jgi:hypothetical protein
VVFGATIQSQIERQATVLSPGRYGVVGHSPQYGDARYECEAGAPFIVTAYTVTHIEMTCPIA